MKKRPSETYIIERIEAHNVAIEALRVHEPADGDPTGLAKAFRHKLACRLDNEIQKWMDSLPKE